MSFAQDTALAPAGPGRWTAAYDERWRVVRGPFGGWIAALLARAIEHTTDWPPRTLTIHFLDAPEPGEVAIAAEVLREGRSSLAIALELEQGGRPMARALATAGACREAEHEWLELAPPAGPGPGELPRLDPRPPTPNFFREIDIRWVDGSPPLPPGGDARNTLWLSVGTLDVPALAALSDVVMPPAFSRLGRFAIVPTLDMTIHFRAPIPDGEEWVLAAQRSDHAAGGTWTCDGELWARDGSLLAQVRQLAMLRT